MPNGKPGDHPLTDMLVHGQHPFPPDVEGMLREVLRLDPAFPGGERPHADQLRWSAMLMDWARGEGLDQGRQALQKVLLEIRKGESI